MIEKLACKVGRKDEVPNIELAELLCQRADTTGTKEIVDGLKDKDKAVASDCIKVLYEIGARKPALISAYVDDFLALLATKSNRLVWGGMTALATITDFSPGLIYDKTDAVLSVFRNGSVIAVDNSVTVLARLCKTGKAYENLLFPLLLEHLRTCRSKEDGQTQCIQTQTGLSHSQTPTAAVQIRMYCCRLRFSVSRVSPQSRRISERRR